MARIVIDEFGDKLYYNNYDQYHREDGPAVIYQHGPMSWYCNGIGNRKDAPAWQRPSGFKVWLVNGNRIWPTLK